MNAKWSTKVSCTLLTMIRGHRGHLLNKGHDRRMVQIAAASIHQRDEYLLNEAGNRERDLFRLSCEQCIAQILLVQADAEAGLEITCDDHGSLCIQNRTS